MQPITGRPDDRPWSERHKAVLWLAMLLAVIVLSALAIRGLEKVSSSSRSQEFRFAKFLRSPSHPDSYVALRE